MPASTTLKLTGTIVGLASGSQTVDVAYTNATAPDVRLSLDVPDAGFVKFDVPPTATTRSPTLMLALAAGVPENTRVTRSPDRSGTTSVPMPENRPFDCSRKRRYAVGSR